MHQAIAQLMHHGTELLMLNDTKHLGRWRHHHHRRRSQSGFGFWRIAGETVADALDLGDRLLQRFAVGPLRRCRCDLGQYGTQQHQHKAGIDAKP